VKEDVRQRMIEFLPRLRRFAFSLTSDWDQSEDLVQDTYVRALSKIDQWQVGTSLESWLFRIAQNLWKDGLKAKKVRGSTTDIGTVQDLIGTDGRTNMESRLTLNAVTKMIEQLPADQRVLIALVCIDGLSYKEAADVLETPIGTVMSRLCRARQSLYSMINEQSPVSESTKLENRRG